MFLSDPVLAVVQREIRLSRLDTRRDCGTTGFGGHAKRRVFVLMGLDERGGSHIECAAMAGSGTRKRASMRSEARWKWEETDPDRSGSSGDLAKLFKNESVKNPGIFAATAPSEHASLMAREVIQNSSDAAGELSDDLGEHAPEFEIAFEFESLKNGAKRSFVKVLDLASIAARGTNAADPDWRSRLGLDRDDVLDHLHDASPLRVLKVLESGTTGMYGPFNGAKSKMYLALISLGYTAKADGAGGS